MSGANPVETKTEPAAALNPPSPGPAPAAGWLGRHKTLGLVVAGSGLVLAGGWYGLTHFKAAPPPVVAQSAEPAPAPDVAPPPTRPEEPVRRADPAPEAMPEIKVPAVSDINVPATTRPADSGFADLPPPPVPDREGKPHKPAPAAPLIETPPIPDGPAKDKAADTAPPVLLTEPPVPEPDKKKAADPDKGTTADPAKKPEGDPFQAPGGLPEADKPKVDGVRIGPAPMADVKPPVITTGGTGDPTPPPPPVPDKKADATAPPPVPTLDVTPPAPPKPDADKKTDLPPLLISPNPDADKGDAGKPPAVSPPKPDPDKADAVKPAPGKKDEPPTLVIPKRPAVGPAPAADSKKDEPPTLPKIDLTGPEAVKPPAVTADPPAPPAVGPMPPAVAAPAGPKKKDMYDEDWHTPRPGDTFLVVSQEYYHDAKYAPALEAYNKDRRKADEKFIRVPPPWVLREQFPNLVPADKDDRPAGPEAKPAGNVKVEPAASPTPVTPIATSRPAPPAAGGATAPAGPSDEYRVLAKEGESIRDIAQKVLGNSNAWRKLWDLNPDVDPTQPIPVGTTLRVPRAGQP